MPGTCSICERQVVTEQFANGNYKGACSDCRENHDRPPRHVETCEREDCPVCYDYRQEFGEAP